MSGTASAKLIPLDNEAHRDQFFELNVEFLSWITDVMKDRYGVDIFSIMDGTVHDYVELVIEKFLTIRPPSGITYLLEVNGNIVGMGALTKAGEGIGEIKRMYIRPKFRGCGYGRKLLEKLLEDAKEFGYSKLRLESGIYMETAHRIYRSEGFIEIDKYDGYETPEPFLPYTIFMEKKL